MSEEMTDFVAALERHVRTRLAEMGGEADYCREAVEIADARNRLFRDAGLRDTDEAENVYALRDLCRIDEDTMMLTPDRGKLLNAGRNCGLSAD